MSVMPRRPGPHYGHYDENGQWQRTKFCLRSCGSNCDCGPPSGVWYSEQHDKRKQQRTDSDSGEGA